MTYSPDSGPKRLMRSEDRWIGGVCGGLADYFGLDPALVRLLFVASILLPGPQLLIYVILWFVMPDSRASRARGGSPPHVLRRPVRTTSAGRASQFERA